MYYSRKTNGFYTLEIHGDNMPDDCIEITDTEWDLLLAGQSNGMVIRGDANGAPYLADAEPGPVDEDYILDQKIQEEIRAMAIERLSSRGELPSNFKERTNDL